MAVYTQLSAQEVEAFLTRFGWASIEALKATDSGIENTNYFVIANDSGGQQIPLVLTLFEKTSTDSLPYFVTLTSFLAECGIPVPKPFRDHNGDAIQTLKGKPAVVVPRFAGHHISVPNPQQCNTISSAMAKMHSASSAFTLKRPNDRSYQWRTASLQTLQTLIPNDHFALLADQVQQWEHQRNQIECLPRGITHNDLFHDNALFVDNTLSGIIDFYNACDDVFIYDLAVLVNDWCSNDDYSLDPQRYQAVMSGYEVVRPLTEAEKTLWPNMLRFAAVRFWISRLLSWHSADAQQVTQKNPDDMRLLLLERMHLPALLDRA